MDTTNRHQRRTRRKDEAPPSSKGRSGHPAISGNPANLGEALVRIADMENPPRIFAAGSDALDTIMPAVEARLHDMRAHDALSRSAGGSFEVFATAS